MVPYSTNIGSGGVIAGLLAIDTGDLIQAWPLLQYKAKRKGVTRAIFFWVSLFVFGFFPGVS